MNPEKVIREAEVPRDATYATVEVDATSANLFLVIGAAFVGVGLVDLALLWTPFRFGEPAWEFAILSRTFTSLPFTGLGLVLAAVGIVRHPSARGIWIRGAAIVFALVALTLVVLGLLFVTVAPEVVRQTPVEGLEAVGETIFKNGAEILLYTLAFAVMAIFLWRGVKRMK